MLLFVGTYALDRSAYHGDFTLPSFVIQDNADGARQILTTMAAAVITVVGVVFSITIVALTLASTQFGPRMLRNFIRDRGTQHTLGAFVATFVFAVLALVAIGNGAQRPFVPNISITVALFALVFDMGVLIYFINHITNSIQLPQAIASIARDLATAIAAEGWRGDAPASRRPAFRSRRSNTRWPSRPASCARREAAICSSCTTTPSCGSRARQTP